MNKQEFYLNSMVQFNLIKQMVYRENAFISFGNERSARCVVVSNIEQILKNMERFKFFSRGYNIYSSVARYDFAQMNKDMKIPPFSFHLLRRKEERSLFFSKLTEKYVLEYDLILDFDSKEHGFKKCYDDTALVKNQFDVLRIPYILRFSGSGFHIIVPGKYIRSPPERKDKPHFLKKFAFNTRIAWDLSTLDLKIYDLRRIVKSSYSIDIKTGNVCLPLTDEQFNNFTISMVKPENVLKMGNLFTRGPCLRDGYIDAFDKHCAEVLSMEVKNELD